MFLLVLNDSKYFLSLVFAAFAADSDCLMSYTGIVILKISETVRVFSKMYPILKSKNVDINKLISEWRDVSQIISVDIEAPMSKKFIFQELRQKISLLLPRACLNLKKRGNRNPERSAALLGVGLIKMHQYTSLPPRPKNFSKTPVYRRLNAAIETTSRALLRPAKPFSKKRINNSLVLVLDSFEILVKTPRFKELYLFRMPIQSYSCIKNASAINIQSLSDIEKILQYLLKAMNYLKSNLNKSSSSSAKEVLSFFSGIEVKKNIHLFAKAALIDNLKSKVRIPKRLNLTADKSYSYLETQIKKLSLMRKNKEFYGTRWANLENLRRSVDRNYISRS